MDALDTLLWVSHNAAIKVLGRAEVSPEGFTEQVHRSGFSEDSVLFYVGLSNIIAYFKARRIEVESVLARRKSRSFET